MSINFNGKILAADEPIFGAGNRAFRYGDGIFETIRMFDGQIPFWSYHYARLKEGASYLQFEAFPSSDFYKKEIEKLCGKQGNHRIRLSVFRKDGGLYTPENSETEFLIEAQTLTSSHFDLNKKGLKIGLCETIRIARHPLSNLKTINSLTYVIAGIFNAKNHLDDCILLNDAGQIAEAVSSNIFVLKNKSLLTPPLTSGCKAGTMRLIILELAKDIQLHAVETDLTIETLVEADEIWLSNAIQGIRWVAEFQGHQKTNNTAHLMLEVLKKKRLLNSLP